MASQWPTTVTGREVVSVNRTDRSDGYDWIAHLRFTYSNGVVGNWNLSGGISHRGRFTEWLTTTYADGHTDVTTGQPLMVHKTLRDLSIEETIAQISRLIEKAGSRPQQ